METMIFIFILQYYFHLRNGTAISKNTPALLFTVLYVVSSQISLRKVVSQEELKTAFPFQDFQNCQATALSSQCT